MGKFDDLPYDTILAMLPYIEDYRTLCRFGTCNKILNEVTKDDELWIVICKNFLPASRFNAQYARTMAFSDATWKGWHRFFISIHTEAKALQIAQLISESNSDRVNNDFVRTAKDTIGKMLDLPLRSGGCIGVNGAALLSRILTDNRHLQTLDLHGQLVRVEGVTSLQSALLSCRNLHSLILSQNKLGPQGAVIVAGLFKTSQITSIDLRSNYFGPEGAKALAQGLQANMSRNVLKRLFLDDNSLGDKDGAAIIAASFAKLDTLFLRDNGLGKHAWAEIQKILANLPLPPSPPAIVEKRKAAPKPVAKVLDVSNTATKKEGGNLFPISEHDISIVVQLAKSKGVTLPAPPGGKMTQSNSCLCS